MQPQKVMSTKVFSYPKVLQGSLVIGNTWAILHDPDVYPEPDAFKPERFINPDGSVREDPALTTAFGYGRRICPGRHFVDATLFIVVASLLSVFDIKRGREGEEGSGAFEYRETCTGNLTR
ncbi:cytochrome P450 [Multifurca ochricompacta]|uniref:Cytochrome P450 n=1 Tax=Multifurca ochricompacta TaxID=376703 RepID=A0AAD4LVE0_9AGAM|nr:cytochrome P450 [Multifurca ochricompacta]